ncbi:MAG: T9SS C-terminal target domain-containing protein [Chitinophagaceae bacterium]|nr:MAG: T9SS C-terminal target domain-containing protein [Chitinophagaceae bacterium]
MRKGLFYTKLFTKFLMVFVLILLSNTSLCSQNCWQNFYPIISGFTNSFKYSKIFPHSNGFYVYELGSAFSNGYQNRYLYSFDEYGNLVFKKYISNNTTNVTGNNISVAEDGAFFSATTKLNGIDFVAQNGDTVEYKNLILRKYNQQGISTSNEWEFIYFDNQNYIGGELFVKELDNGDILGAFSICDITLLPDSCFATHTRLIRLTSDGNLVFINDYEDFVFTGIVGLDDGSYLVSAYDRQSTLSGSLHLLKLNNNGDTLWSVDYNENANFLSSIHKTSDNHILLQSLGRLLKIDLDGDTVFTIGPGASYQNVQAIENGQFVGLTSTGHGNQFRLGLQKFDANGQLIDELTLPNDSLSGPLGDAQSRFFRHDLKITDDGRYYISAFRQNNSSGPQGLFVMSMDGMQTCPEPISEEENIGKPNCMFLDAGNVKASLCTDGLLFSPIYDGGYFTPSDSITSTIFTSNFWMGGVDANTDSLHVSQKVYNINGQYWPGQRSENNILSPAESNLWDKVWQVRHTDVVNHINDFLQNGQIDNPNPFIFEWPGKGNIHAIGNNGNPLLVDNEAAPFVDLNGNGIYEPHLGEYPAIKGCQMHWFVVNDYLHDEYLYYNNWSAGDKVGADIQVSAYAFSDADDPELYNSIITEFKVINRSGRDYEDFYFGNFIDFEIGCFNTDYMGSNIPTHTFYGYSATETDPDCSTPGYGQHPPVQTATFLNHSMSSFRLYTSSFSPPHAQPSTKEHFYNFLLGLWTDGSPITEGAPGIGGTVPTKYMFSGNPANPQEWSECSENITPGDRKGFASTGPFSLPQNASLEIKMLYTTHYQEDLGGCFDFDAKVKPVVEDLRNSFPNYVECINEGAIPEIPDSMIIYDIEEVLHDSLFINLYPNPSTGQFILELHFEENTDFQIKVYNALGQKVYRSENLFTFANQVVKEEIDIGYTKGVYFLQLIMGGEKLHKRLVVQ